MVTDPLPSTSITPDGLTSAAVSSSTPMPSRAGDCATSASSRPIRFRCSKCWSMITPGSRPRPALIWVMRCFGVVPLVPNATMWLLMAEAPALVPATISPCRCRSMMARPRAVPPITLERRSWLPPVMKMPVASRTASIAGRLVRLLPGERPQAAHIGDAELSEEGPIQLGRLVAERGRGGDDRHPRIGPAGQRGEARQDLALSQLVLGAADDQQVPGAWRRRPPWEACRAAAYRRARSDGEVSAVVSSPDGRRSRGTHRAARLLRGARRRAVGHRRRAARRLPRGGPAPPSRTAATASPLATRRTAVLNRAWRELRDPLRRLHYDHALERGTAATLAWPLDSDEAPSPPLDGAASRARAPPSRWHQPQWRSVARLPRPGRGLHGRAQRAERLDRGQPHRRRGLARAPRALLAALRGRLLPRSGPDRRLDRRAGAAGRAGRHLRHAGAAPTCGRPTCSTGMFLRGIGFLRRGRGVSPPAAASADGSTASCGRCWASSATSACGRARSRIGPRRPSCCSTTWRRSRWSRASPTCGPRSWPCAGPAMSAAPRSSSSGSRPQPVTEPARWFSIVQLLTEAGQLDRASVAAGGDRTRRSSGGARPPPDRRRSRCGASRLRVVGWFVRASVPQCGSERAAATTRRRITDRPIIHCRLTLSLRACARLRR